MFDWIKEYAPYISNICTFLGIMKCAPTFIKKARKEWKDFEEDNDLNINEIYGKLEEDEIHVGSNIYTSGYLLQYGQVFVPYTYTDSVFSPSSEEELEDFNRIYKGTIHEIRGKEILFQKKDVIIPTKKINLFNTIGCAFLYDEKFNGFYTQENNSIYTKPILVLYDVNRHMRYLNKKVEIKGKLCLVPEEIVQSLNLTYNDTVRDICSNFYRPFNETNNLICISLLQEDSKIKCLTNPTMEDNGLDIMLPVFVEAKIDGVLLEKNPEKVIGKMLPNTYDKYLGVNVDMPFFKTEKYDAASPASTDNINVLYRNGNIGFYMNTSLTDKQRYEKDLERYVRYVNNFAIDYKNFCKKELGRKERMEITFISDDTKRNLFMGKYANNIFEDERFKDSPEAQWMNDA